MAEHFDPNDKFSWYFGPLSREETNEMFENVSTNGKFLVRDSQSIRGDFVLCVREDNKISHYIVNKIQVGSSMMFRIGDHQFPDIPALLNFYKTHYLDTTALTYPVDREKVLAKYDFPGKDPEDLPFRKGEILEILTKDEDKWWMARNKEGKVGQIPVPYVVKYDARGTDELRISSSPQNQDLLSHPAPDPPRIEPQQPKIHLPDKLPAKAQVTLARIPSVFDTTQLRLREGEIITVLKINANGQWEGETEGGKRGLFPFTHIKFLDENS